MTLKVFNPDNNSEVPLAQAKVLDSVWVVVDWYEWSILGAYLSKQQAIEAQEKLIDRGFHCCSDIRELNLIGE